MLKKKLLMAFLLFLTVALMTVFFCDKAVENTTKGRLYSSVDSLPYRKTGLLLGTAKFLADGRINLYYAYRIDAAAALYKAGKIRYLIISGDNSRKAYNEPADMRADLIKKGVDSSFILPDYAGFRTFDSMVRLREIFSQDSVTIISQPFHNERAVYIAGREGITAVGFNARDVGNRAGLKVQVREKLARVKLFLDYLIGQEPKFLGEKITIP